VPYTIAVSKRRCALLSDRHFLVTVAVNAGLVFRP
jgi:hypothetical protein